MDNSKKVNEDFHVLIIGAATLFERETYLNQDARATGTSASTTPQAPPWRNACRDHLSRDMAAAMVDPRRVASAKDAFSYV
ncbi:MAG: hypothetical protein LQ350_002121 [Teloschistes chrysophthalmus]|nr:MAG: hypothetical protein LQ350_002121 [Niorma chrysophthalma]